MRVWTLDERGDDHTCIRLPLTGIAFCLDDDSGHDHHFASLGQMARFIVDALNEKEMREEDDLDDGRYESMTEGVEQIPLNDGTTLHIPKLATLTAHDVSTK